MPKTEYILDDEQRRVVEANIPLVHYIISMYFGSSPVDYDDLCSIGYISLCKAAVRYKPEASAKFGTYAAKAIIHDIKNAHKHLMVMNDQLESNGLHLVSLNVKFDPTDDESDELLDTVADATVDVESEVADGLFYDSVRNMVPTYATIVESGLTISEYARERRISRQRVSKKVDMELRRARYKIKAQRLVA